ncbi:Ig-like domain-containing protein [Thermodesulfobacteriota bacterium]
MKKVMTKVTRLTAILMFITVAIILMAPLAFGAEVYNQPFSEGSLDGATRVGGEFITFSNGDEGFRATLAANPKGPQPTSYIESDSSDIADLREGTIEFWIQRNREGVVIRRENKSQYVVTYDTVFEILSPENKTLVSCMVSWDYGYSENSSALTFNYVSKVDGEATKMVWGYSVPFGFKPAIGDWVHVALTFGQTPSEENRVYINGNRYKTRYNESRFKAGDTYAGLLSDYLTASNRIRFGIETGSSLNYPGGAALMHHSVLDSFVVHDEILTTFDLNKFSTSGMPSNLSAEVVEAEVVLKWVKARSEDTVGYNVYRKVAVNGSYAKLNDADVDAFTFADTTAEDGKSYKYLAKGVDRDGNESNASNEASITIVSEDIRVTETSTDNDPTNLTGRYVDGKILISWGAPKAVTPLGYYVYRRAGEGAAEFIKLNSALLTAVEYSDADIIADSTYYYSVTAILPDGKEGKYPSEIMVVASDVAISSISIDPARAVREGEEVTVTVRGTEGKTASFSVANVAENVALTETTAGVYYGAFIAGSYSVKGAALSVTVGGANKVASSTITVDNDAPAQVTGLDIRNDWEVEINIDWQPVSDADFKQYNIYRSTEEITGLHGLEPYKVVENKDISEFWDQDVIPNMVYYYAVAVVDNAGNVGAMSDVVSADVLPDTSLPVIFRITESSAGVKVREGDTLEITVEGETDCVASFSIGSLVNDAPLTEGSRLGIYTGRYTVRAQEVANDFIVVKLVDRSDNTSTYASADKVDIDGSVQTDTIPPTIDSVSENSWSIAGFSGQLVAGDMLTVELKGEAGGVAYFDINGVASRVRMTEDAAQGTYTGTYTVVSGAYAKDTTVTAYLADSAGNTSSLSASTVFTVDTNVNIEVTASKNTIPADERTRVEVIAKVTDLNGDEVSGHKIKFTMTTTDEYTGIVGGGRYTEFEDTVGGTLRTEWRGETDAFGEVSATYKAGFAAKTALVLAKDLTTGNIGVGYVASFITSSIDITLTQVDRSRRRIRKAGRGVYINVTATPEKLTADGVSTSRIRARVTDVNGQPVANERIVFSMSSSNGRLAAVDQTTDIRGIAEAVYTAGIQIGTVIITAVDTTVGISGSTMVILMSDAPAKIYMSASPLTLPADGLSKADIDIQVSDVNDNPNQGAVVEYDIIQGNGRLDMDINETDRNGEVRNGFRAGHFPGTVTIQAKVTSRIPSVQEVNRANGTIFVGEIYEDFEIATVKEWYKEIGDTIEKGDVVARIITDVGEFDITSRTTGTLHAIKIYKNEEFGIGETLGIIEIE